MHLYSSHRSLVKTLLTMNTHGCAQKQEKWTWNGFPIGHVLCRVWSTEVARNARFLQGKPSPQPRALRKGGWLKAEVLWLEQLSADATRSTRHFWGFHCRKEELKVLPRTHLGQKEWICGSLCKTRMRNKAASWGIHGLCSVTYFIRAGGKTIWPQFQTPPFVSLACVLWSLPQGLCHCLTSMLQIPSDSPG